jgi:hypothetical protein
MLLLILVYLAGVGTAALLSRAASTYAIRSFQRIQAARIDADLKTAEARLEELRQANAIREARNNSILALSAEYGRRKGDKPN